MLFFNRGLHKENQSKERKNRFLLSQEWQTRDEIASAPTNNIGASQ
jgi:hypothetical protein